jgi:N-acetylneuraminic acid mutarotase
MGALTQGSSILRVAQRALCAVAVSGCSTMSSAPAAPRDHDDGAAGTWRMIDGAGGPTAGLLEPAVSADGAVILWGGSGPCGDAGACGDGARFDLATGRFVAMTSVGAPAARFLHTGVWGEGQVLIWGGAGCAAASCGDGAAYDPARDRWAALATSGAPAPRGWHTAVFTGSEMIVWGGEDASSRKLFGDGARYDPGHAAWKPMTGDGAPAARRYHAAVWTGTEMVIWGGDRSATRDDGFGDGAAYNPTRDRWRALDSKGAPAARWAHTAVWTGTQMIVWGGLGCGRDTASEPVLCGTGAAYDPAADRWTTLSTDGAPTPRSGHSAVWTGQQMIVWGGSAVRCADGSSGACADGAAYDPAGDRWTQLTAAGRPAARSGHVAAWTGRAMFVWGGIGGAAETAYRDGALYLGDARAAAVRAR